MSYLRTSHKEISFLATELARLNHFSTNRTFQVKALDEIIQALVVEKERLKLLALTE